MPSAIFKRNLESINVELSDKQIEQLDKYYEILVEWNSFMNLTGITEYEEVMLKHYLDSLVLRLPIDGSNLNIKLIDVGTGAGFPGLPLKIAYPDTEVVLFDSLNKRIKFLDEVIAQLGLKGISTVHGRAEDGGKSKELREQFDVSVSRAVADLSVLLLATSYSRLPHFIKKPLLTGVTLTVPSCLAHSDCPSAIRLANSCLVVVNTAFANLLAGKSAIKSTKRYFILPSSYSAVTFGWIIHFLLF